MDKFKTYLQDHRDQLDEETPDCRLWDQIEQNAFPAEKKKVRVLSWKWMAAAVCLLFLFGGFYWFMHESEKDVNIPAFAATGSSVPKTIPDKETKEESTKEKEQPQAKTKENTVALLSKKKPLSAPENKHTATKKAEPRYVIEDVEIGNFSQIIDYQRQYISTLPIYGQNPNYFKDFKQQLHQMDNDEKEVRKDIQKNGLNPDQIGLLINIYQHKITLLKQLNQEINRVNKSYYQNHLEKDSAKTATPHFLNI